nr:MAG TPA: hypothetical protein [Caudoviricetes sp.]
MRRAFLLLPVPLRIMDVAYANGTAEILLDSILDVMSTETFSKDKAAYIVGGEKKLLRLIEAGEVDSDKPSNSQNGKWRCNASQVLRHCRCTRKKKYKRKRKSQKNEKN